MRNGHLFLFFFLQKGKSVFQSFLVVSEKLMLASTFCFITENTRHKIWSFINMRTALVAPQLFLTRPCKIIETDFTTAFLGWTSEGKSVSYLQLAYSVSSSEIWKDWKMYLMITSIVIYGIPALPGGEQYCHTSVDVGGFTRRCMALKATGAWAHALTTQLRWAMWSPTTPKHLHNTWPCSGETVPKHPSCLLHLHTRTQACTHVRRRAHTYKACTQTRMCPLGGFSGSLPTLAQGSLTLLTLYGVESRESNVKGNLFISCYGLLRLTPKEIVDGGTLSACWLSCQIY